MLNNKTFLNIFRKKKLNSLKYLIIKMNQMFDINLNVMILSFLFSILIYLILCKLEQKGYLKNISDVYPNAKFDVYDVTELNFIQGEKLGNCGMIASMASLARNREVLEKVVPVNQSFNEKPSEFAFNLYKRGKPHRVVVNESLFLRKFSCLSFLFNMKKLYYSQSHNNNFVGPLLEKALIKLHFDKDYDLSYGVSVSTVLSSFTNNFFEEFSKADLSRLDYKLKSVIAHGRTNKCLMVVSFNKNTFSLVSDHAYTIVDCKKDKVYLYNPHRKYVTVPIKCLNKNLQRLFISYTGNKVFKMANVNTVKEFSDCWTEVSADKRVSSVGYHLTVEEDDTEVLINLIKSQYADVFRKIYLSNGETFKWEQGNDIFIAKSASTFRKKLKRGNYQMKFVQCFKTSKDAHGKSINAKYLDCSKMDKNNFCFRIAASKSCEVKKC